MERAGEQAGPCGLIDVPSGDLELHHTAYVVPNLETALRAWQATLGATLEAGPTRVRADEVKVCFLRYPGGRVELVWHEHGSAKGSHAPAGARPDHVCFLCSDLDARLAAARDHGGLIVRPPVPSEAFQGRRMSFVIYRNVGLIEWVQR